MTIYFYSVRDEHGYMSNFAAYPIVLKGKRWPTTEHYFQAQKFVGTSHEEAIRRAKSPKLAAEMGRDRSRSLRRDWESAKDNVMREAVLEKFTAHPDIRAMLLATGDEPLVEQTSHDYYWGCGTDGSGRNMLGHILVEVRSALREMESEGT
jgi:ribA/ribD-fused uncharacterized protein